MNTRFRFISFVVLVAMFLAACGPTTQPAEAAPDAANAIRISVLEESAGLQPPVTSTPISISTNEAKNGFKFEGMLSRYSDGTLRLYGILTHIDGSPLGGTFMYFFVGDKKPEKMDVLGVVDYSMDEITLSSLMIKVTDAANGDSCSMALPTVILPQGTHVNVRCDF